MKIYCNVSNKYRKSKKTNIYIYIYIYIYIDVVMPMYNLIECDDNCSET